MLSDFNKTLTSLGGVFAKNWKTSSIGAVGASVGAILVHYQILTPEAAALWLALVIGLVSLFAEDGTPKEGDK